MPYTESQRKANKAYYERNKEIICLHEKVKYWDSSNDRETMKNASKRSYYKAQIRKLEEQLNELPPEVVWEKPPTIVQIV
jgi:hypothetical protein